MQLYFTSVQAMLAGIQPAAAAARGGLVKLSSPAPDKSRFLSRHCVNTKSEQHHLGGRSNILQSAAGLPVLNGGWKFFGFLPEREWGRGQCHPGRSNIRRAKGFCHSVSSRCTRRSKRLQCPIEPQCPSRFSVLCTMGGTRTNMR